MSDRIIGAPDLETRVDDLRAVIDAAGIEQAELPSWSVGAPQLERCWFPPAWRSGPISIHRLGAFFP